MQRSALLFLPILALFIYGQALAAPTFTWLGDWQATFPETFAIGDGDAKSDFASKPSDATAMLKARSRADNDFEVDSLFTADVRAERSFRLANSPTGWQVSLSTTLKGSLSTGEEFFFDPKYSAAVSADGQIRGTQISTSHNNSVSGEGKSASIDESKNSTGRLRDGDYVISGSLFTQAEASKSVGAEDDARADFTNITFPPPLPPITITRGFDISVSTYALGESPPILSGSGWQADCDLPGCGQSPVAAYAPYPNGVTAPDPTTTDAKLMWYWGAGDYIGTPTGVSGPIEASFTYSFSLDGLAAPLGAWVAADDRLTLEVNGKDLGLVFILDQNQDPVTKQPIAKWFPFDPDWFDYSPGATNALTIRANDGESRPSDRAYEYVFFDAVSGIDQQPRFLSVPEPGSIALLTAGLAVMGFCSRRKGQAYVGRL